MSVNPQNVGGVVGGVQKSAEVSEKVAKEGENLIKKAMPVAFLVLALLLARIFKDDKTFDDQFIHKFLFSFVIVLTLAMTYKNFMGGKEYYEDMVEGFVSASSYGECANITNHRFGGKGCFNPRKRQCLPAVGNNRSTICTDRGAQKIGF